MAEGVLLMNTLTAQQEGICHESGWEVFCSSLSYRPAGQSPCGPAETSPSPGATRALMPAVTFPYPSLGLSSDLDPAMRTKFAWT